MTASKYKKVLLPISVPNNDFCWSDEAICSNFDNEGGLPVCELNLGYLNYENNTSIVKKPDKCKSLIQKVGI